MSLQINWIRCTNGLWCSFNGLGLSNPRYVDLNGLYIIWSSEKTNVIRIGSGQIKSRILAHRKDDKINSYPDLYVTWAKVNGNQMEGVEKFLSDRLNPKLGERFPDRTPIEVNLPW